MSNRNISMNFIGNTLYSQLTQEELDVIASSIESGGGYKLSQRDDESDNEFCMRKVAVKQAISQLTRFAKNCIRENREQARREENLARIRKNQVKKLRHRAGLPSTPVRRTAKAL